MELLACSPLSYITNGFSYLKKSKAGFHSQLKPSPSLPPGTFGGLVGELGILLNILFLKHDLSYVSLGTKKPGGIA